VRAPTHRAGGPARRESLDHVNRRPVLVVAVLAAAAALALSGCQTRIATAAIVGDQRITDDQFQSLVHDALSAPGVRQALPASAYKGDLAAYRRAILNLEVMRRLADSAAASVQVGSDEGKVNELYRFAEQQHGTPAQFQDYLARSGAISPELYREVLRLQVIESEIGYQVGHVHRPTDAELRSLYEKNAASLGTATLRIVQVPSDTVARDAVARAQQDPSTLDALAKQYAAGQQTSTAPQSIPLSQLPADLPAKLATLHPGEVFAYTLSGQSGDAFFVIQFGGVTRPTFEASRPQLESQSFQTAAEAGRGVVTTFAKKVGVQVNPRYGAWSADKLAIVDYTNPAVRTIAPPPTAAVPGQGGTG
jgi:PPIC-type PPIASE domain/SurA N-terminal domain